MEVKASLNRYRQSPRKVRLVTNLIKGKPVDQAIVELRLLTKRAGDPIAKLVRSAVANAKNNFKLDGTDLYIKNITVNEGPTMKRFMPRAFGRAAMIRKRSSHIHVTLSDEKPLKGKGARKAAATK